MPTAIREVALRRHQAIGIERGVIVQTTTYGADHSVVLDGLAAMGPNYRGCANALVFAEADDAYLDELNQAGMRGARFSFHKALEVILSRKDFDRAIARVKELGWYVKVQPDKEGILSVLEYFERLGFPVLIDHMGKPDASRGLADPNAVKVIELLKRENFWVMLSLGEKVSRTGSPWDDVVPIARAYIETAPDRCVWATDWPHPISMAQPPNEGDLLDLCFRYAPSEAERKAVLVDNPARLFGFLPAAESR